MRRFPFDSVLCAFSLLDHFIYSFAGEFLPVANAQGVAVVGMKVMALGKLAHIYDEALRYTFSLPIATAVVGMESMEQLEKNLAVAEAYKPFGMPPQDKPLTGADRLELFRALLPLVTPGNVPWKAADWDNPAEWKPRPALYR